MKKYLLATALLSIFSLTSAQAQNLIDVQFGGNDYGSPAAVQTGVGLIGSSGDIWNNYTSDSALESGVNVYDSTGTFSGATLTINGSSGIYQYSDGLGSGSDTLSGSSVGALASGELGGAGTGATVTLTLNSLPANTTYQVYLLSAPDRWERSSSWSVNGGTAQDVGPLNAYTGPDRPYNPYGGSAPYNPVLGVNYLVLTGTSDASGKLTILGTGLSGDADINGFQLQAQAAPEPSTWALLMTGVVFLCALRRKYSSAA